MRYLAFIIILIGASCRSGTKTPSLAVAPIDSSLSIPKIIADIPVPEGYKRIMVETGSFAQWLRELPLKKEKQVYLYNGKLKSNQSAQFAVVDIAIGKKDLQQCADAVMRFRAEYLYANKRYSEIAFMDYSGKWYRWEGMDDRPGFDQYLQQVFGWCGSASLEKQLEPVRRFSDIQPGDVLIMGGFPGHAMIVVDMAKMSDGKKIFMLAQGYQPAQDIHVVVNPRDTSLSPWYMVNGEDVIHTPEWQFTRSSLKRW